MEKRPTRELVDVSPVVGDGPASSIMNPAATFYEKTTNITSLTVAETKRDSYNSEAVTTESGDKAATVATIPPLHDLAVDSVLDRHVTPRSNLSADPTAAEFIDDEGEGGGATSELLGDREEDGDDGLDKVMRFSFKARDRTSLPPVRSKSRSAADNLPGDMDVNRNRSSLSPEARDRSSLPAQTVHSAPEAYVRTHYANIGEDLAPLGGLVQQQADGADTLTVSQFSESSRRTTTNSSTPERVCSLPPLAHYKTPTFESGQVGSVYHDLPYHRRANVPGAHNDEEEEEIKSLRYKIQLLTQQANISQEARGRVLVQILQEGMHHSLANEPDHIDNENSALQHGGVFERAVGGQPVTPAAEAGNKQHFVDSSPTVATAERTRLIRTQSSSAAVGASSSVSQQPQASTQAVVDRRTSSKSSNPPAAIANDPQVKDVLLHQNAQPSPAQAAATQVVREQNAGAGIRQLCRIFCCPPTPGAIASKLAFVPPEPSYDMVPKAHENNGINDADGAARCPAGSRARVLGKSNTGSNEPEAVLSNKLSNSSSALSTSTAASTTNTPKLVRRNGGDGSDAVIKESSSTVSIPGTAQNTTGGNGDGAESHAYKRKKRMQAPETQQQPSQLNDSALSPPLQRPPQSIDSVRDSYYLCLGGNFLEWTWGVHELQNNVEMFYARTARGSRIACMYVRTAPEAEFTLLFSHGNAVDIGQMVPFYWSLGDRFRVNICAYDYSGYGKSSGKPSERNLYADIDGAWQAIRERYSVTEDQVILYGQSIGTVPTVDLASRNQNFAGVILHGPLASGLRIAFPETRRSCFFDVFRSIDKVHRINVPTLVIHGTEDEVIPLSNALALYEKLPNAVEPLFVEGGGHNDIELYAAYYLRLQQFIREEVQPFRQSRRRQQQQQQLKDMPSSGRGSQGIVTNTNSVTTTSASTVRTNVTN